MTASVTAPPGVNGGVTMRGRQPSGAATRIRRAVTRDRLPGIAGIATLAGLTVLALLARTIAPHDPALPVGLPFQAPGSSGAPLGTDQVGRDMLSRLLVGLRTSWLATLTLVAIVATVGGLFGAVAGYVGGFVDGVMMRIVDLFLALPGAVLAIVIVAIMGPSMPHALLGIGIVAWPYYARLARTEVRALVSRPHLEAARIAGASRPRLIFRHLLPGAVPSLIVNASLDLGQVTISLAGLSFLGLGTPAPAPELGSMSSQGLDYLISNWWIPVLPGLVVLAVAFLANLAGDGIRSLFRYQ
jgi:peptide/nickel transport system permease protein